MRRFPVTVFAILALTLTASVASGQNGSTDTSAAAPADLLQVSSVFNTGEQMQEFGRELQATRHRQAIRRAQQRADARKEAQKRATAAQAAANQASQAPDVSIPAALHAIARCESGGNPRAVSSSGTYRGLFQFDITTWASVGGSGDPAAASRTEQYRRAAMLYARSGASPWPVCGQ